MKTFSVKIEGVTPLLQHRFSDEAQNKPKSRVVSMAADKTPRQEAMKVANVRADGTYFIPGSAFARLAREAGANMKISGTRKFVKYLVPAAMVVLDESVTILDDEGNPAKDFDTDSRPVVIPATKGRVMRHRPRFDRWRATVTVLIDEDIMDDRTVHELFVTGGKKLGIGDFRPEKGGPFGRFNVTGWEEIRA